MRYVLDRIEENIAVIEVTDGGDIRYERVSTAEVDDSAAEGDILVRRSGMYFPDKEKTRAERQDILRKLAGGEKNDAI